MSNIIRLSNDSSNHALTHAAGGSDPLSPSTIGAATSEDIESAIAHHVAANNPHQAATPEDIENAIAQHVENFHQQEDGGSFSSIGIAGKFYEQNLDFLALPFWREILVLKISRGKIELKGMVIQNWEGGGGVVPSPSEIDITSEGTERTIQFQSNYLHVRLLGHGLQVKASGRASYPLVQFTGKVAAWGFAG